MAINQLPSGAGIKKLQGYDMYRMRVGNIRILYTIDEVIRVITIENIDNRGDVYKRLQCDKFYSVGSPARGIYLIKDNVQTKSLKGHLMSGFLRKCTERQHLEAEKQKITLNQYIIQAIAGTLEGKESAI